MKQIQVEQFLPVTVDEAWAFFSNPANLNLITPDKLNFTTLTEVPELMTDGLIIRYKIKPMLSIPINWSNTSSEAISPWSNTSLKVIERNFPSLSTPYTIFFQKSFQNPWSYAFQKATFASRFRKGAKITFQIKI